ncbi:MAG TPA: zf-HC2 domain-containing protein [Candidatus Limnocylindrales bacterium]|nr:zf-HC2 domain-containing protein [Candidatus Limnocylindrales bacterium]
MNDRDCAEIFAKLSQFLDRELPPGACSDIEEHLRDCPECIRFVESLKRSIEFCRQYGASRAPEPVPSEKLAELRAAYDRMLARRR